MRHMNIKMAYPLAGLLLAGLVGCSEETSLKVFKAGNPLANDPPTIWIESGPPEGSVSSYRIEFS
jgi:hypothetical protein